MPLMFMIGLSKKHVKETLLNVDTLTEKSEEFSHAKG